MRVIARIGAQLVNRIKRDKRFFTKEIISKLKTNISEIELEKKREDHEWEFYAERI